MHGTSKPAWRLRNKQKRFGRFWSELEEANCAFVVEGKKDMLALRQAGLTQPIYTAQGSLDKLAEKVAETHECAYLFTDFDDAGEDLLARLRDALEAHSVACNVDARRELRRLVGVRFFENLDHDIEKAKEEWTEREIVNAKKR